MSLTKLGNSNAVAAGEMGFSNASYTANDDEEDEENDRNEDESEDENEGADEEEDEDLSDGEDLCEDLENALESSNFAFKGSYYHASLQPSAPNPCIKISGCGLIGLPLSERDARGIISRASLAPFGRGVQTVVDQSVRHTWEIEPRDIKFGNSEWKAWIEGVCLKAVCEGLGVEMNAKCGPKMELYKLLLYEKGSHFLPHQDTEKANGMFGTAVIVLPSEYTGGQVVVSHSTTTKTIDFASNSLASTALLAWYTDVRHEVKPITSGYRLALSYNLVQSTPGVGRPMLPDTSDNADQLRRILKKWHLRRYKKEPEPRFVAYLLQHQYSAANLTAGQSALKGTDKHRVAVLREVAEELGYLVGLASLEHIVSGTAEPEDYEYGRYSKRGRYGHGCAYDDDEEEEEDEDTDDYEGCSPGMEEILEMSTTMSDLTDLDGHMLLATAGRGVSVRLREGCLIPQEPFEDVEPDHKEYEGYMGNAFFSEYTVWGTVDHFYRRTVLVLLHEDDKDDILYSIYGLRYAFQMLDRSTTIPPSEDDRRWVERILKSTTSLNKEQVLKVVEYARRWRDVNMWKRIMKANICTLGNLGTEELVKAWKAFGFEGVHLSFEEILARSAYVTQLQERLDFINKLPEYASSNEKQAVGAWCQKESDKVIASFKTTDVKGIPVLMQIIRTSGLDSFQRVILPNLLKVDGYAFFMALGKALRDDRPAVIERQRQTQVVTHEQPVNPNSPQKTVDDLIQQCLQTAASQWSSSIDRIIDIIDKTLVYDYPDICRTLLVDILKSPGSSANKFSQLYTPLIPRLHDLLRRRNQDICSPPFSGLIQVLIGIYLRDILGKKPNFHQQRLRKIGCGCGDCKILDHFIVNLPNESQTFSMAQPRRTHLERYLATCPDLCTYTTVRYGSPHRLIVTKLPEVVLASTWNARQRAALKFLALIGPDDIIAKIMGGRYGDVKNAIAGSQQFGSAPPIMTVSMARSSNLGTQAASSRASHLQAAHNVPSAAADGQKAKNKRKNGPNTISGPVT
ncbi:hypothetical protein BDZ97DRAFT_1970033 [Flammula alnicola]|nr:hypothetical protein BDZ97DRAFT_1970033 [Flammula alnicola]